MTTEREKLEMVKMCVDAKLNGTKLDRAFINMGYFPCPENESIGYIFAGIMNGSWTYRIAKPTHKVRFRLYKWHLDSTSFGIDWITSSKMELFVKGNDYFKGWIGDWQEVEIEE